jgi:predicted ATPase
MLELVHSHIAKQPIPPVEVVGQTSQSLTPISDIIMKLMAKNAEDRYQSAYGIRTDLDICLHQWQTIGEIIAFPLAEQDISVRFQIPQKLYGREHEIETVLVTFEQVVEARAGDKSGNELLIVTGYSGVGKSALIHEVHKPITAKQGYFITGKYDQYQRDIPYSALSQALEQFCNHLLTESSAVLDQWRKTIMAAIGENGQLLVEVVPDLELIIGPQPEVTEIGSQESQNRFNLVFQKFIQAISQTEHPLIIFIDDLQWTDLASLNLLKTLMTSEGSQHLLIIGAYRDNEVDDGHPLMLALAEIEKQRKINTIHLQSLAQPDVNALIADTLNCDLAYARPLIDLVYSKTGGNVFFTTEFLNTLYVEELLTFDHQQRKWQWDVQQILAKNITDNVVELIAGKIEQLTKETQLVLELAACIGNQFDLETLAIIYRPSGQMTDILKPSAILGDLWPAVHEGLVTPLNDRYKLIEVTEESDLTPQEVTFKFQHDRVQQAAYSLL